MTRTPARRLSRDPESSPGLAALLSALLPGLGQLYRSRWRRGVLMIVVPAAGLLLIGALAILVGPIASAIVRRASLFALLVVGGLYAYHVTVVADAFAGRTGGGARPRLVIDYALLLAIVVGLSVAYLSVYRHSTIWAGALSALFDQNGRTIAAGTSVGGTSAPGWSGRDRLNILLLGIDTRDDDPETFNTDTVMVISLDPVGKTAAMLSVPRDTLVDIPGIGRDKVNAAFGYAKDPARGPELARRTVEGLLGIPIHTYAVIGFGAFRETVEAVGGVLVDVRRPLRDGSYPTAGAGIERIEFRPGPQVMDGDQALQYARSRHDSNDFSRARRQQVLVFALRGRLGQAGIFRLPGIVQRVGPLVRTSFDPANVLPLARTALGINSADIRSEVLLPCGGDEPHCELTEENGPGGYYLVPDQAKVRALVSDLFGGAKTSTR